MLLARTRIISHHSLLLCALFVHYLPSNLYWTDWNREAPKIETSTVNGANRRVLVHTDIGLPNGLTFDPFSKLLCWADAGNVPRHGPENVTLSFEGKTSVSFSPVLSLGFTDVPGEV